jgi:hypothetical protein
MVTPIDVGLVVAGVVLLFAGAALSIYGVGLLGVVVGGGSAFMLAPEFGLQGVVLAAAVAVGALAGIVVTYLLLSIAIGMLGFAVGTYVGLIVVDFVLDPSGIAPLAVGAVAIGLAAALLGTVFTRTTMVLVTSFLGGALASRSITLSDLETVQDEFTADPILFDLDAPLFLGLFALGVLSQFGLFKLGYVTKLVGLLPGASELTDREESAESE